MYASHCYICFIAYKKSVLVTHCALMGILLFWSTEAHQVYKANFVVIWIWSTQNECSFVRCFKYSCGDHHVINFQ